MAMLTGKISKKHEHSPEIIEKQLCKGWGEVLVLFGSQVRINGIVDTSPEFKYKETFSSRTVHCPMMEMC